MVAIAYLLLEWASDQGFVGIAAYVACWVFMFPIMATVCLIGALFWSFDEEPAPSPSSRTGTGKGALGTPDPLSHTLPPDEKSDVTARAPQRNKRRDPRPPRILDRR